MAESIKDKAEKAGHKLAEKASEVGHKVGEKASEVGHKVGEKMEEAKDWVKEKAREVGIRAPHLCRRAKAPPARPPIFASTWRSMLLAARLSARLITSKAIASS